MGLVHILEIFQEEFEALVKEKTSWGRNELLLIFERAKTRALIRYAEDK